MNNKMEIFDKISKITYDLPPFPVVLISTIDERGIKFVIGIPTSKIIDKLYKTGTKYPSEIDEFKEVGLTPYLSKIVKPSRIKECQANLECKLYWNKEAGNHMMVVGEVIAIDVDSELFNEDLVKMRSDLNSLYHLTSKYFVNDGKILEAKE